ncbi:MAG: transglycosylase SLT domain-containing protein [candidate division NC10 bacterium]|nr:transglycosylase SLT domain-containing protein [candidate division NC10 bacterium]
MPIPAGELRRLLEEERRREAAHRRLRWQRRRRQLAWWLAAAVAAAILFIGVRLSYAGNALGEELADRLRQLEARIEELEEDRLRLTRALLTFEVPAALEFAGEAVPLDRWDVRERLEREVLLSLQQRGQVILWLKRAARYFPYIEEALRGAGLPDDLKYVAVIESALQPQALSSASALGIWQFIPATARRYGLRVTASWDERRHAELATRAALAYLADLYGQFGQWSLALAAYNSGEARVRTAMSRQKVRSYFQLALPKETERYVFRAYAARLILSEPERYGFHIPDEALYRPPAGDRVQVRVRHHLTVMRIAEAAGSFYREVKLLNPAITGDALPGGTFLINLPEGAGKDFTVREQASGVASPAAQRHRVQRGDTLSAIARRYGVRLEEIRRWNPAVSGRAIRPGDVLVIRRTQQ